MPDSIASGTPCSYLKPVLRYTCLILNAYYPDTLFLREQRCEDPWLFFEGKLVRKQKRLGNYLYSIHTYKTA
jgi:hypothetical protein